MITTTAALQKGVVSLDDEFEITNGVNVGGRFIENANGEYCGGTFREAFAESCNADFAPLGPKIGNDDLVGTAERFGFNSPPTLYAPRIVREVDPPESSIPTEIGEELDLGVSAIGQGEVLATPLEMASVAQTIGNGGVREPTSIVANKKLRPDAKPVRVMSKKIADELTELMIGVVTGGTGYAGAIPEAQVAGKTGTAELGPEPGQENAEHPVQIKDAWFAAFAPAEKAQAGDRGAADRSRSRGRRSRRAGRLRSPLRRPLAAPGRGLEVERDLGVFAVGAGDLERQRPVLGGRVGQQEEDQGALDRALLGGRVEHRDLFLGFDFAAERKA